MRILHVIASTDPATGGPVVAIAEVGAFLLEKGHHVDVVTADSPDSPWLSSFPLNVHALGPPKGGRYGFSAAVVPWLRAHAAMYDAVIAHGIWEYACLAVWRACRKERVPYYVYAHGNLDPWFKHAYPGKHIKKWLYWQIFGNRIMRDAQAVLFTCEEEIRLAKQSFSPYRVNARIAPYTSAGANGDLVALRQTFLHDFPGLADKRIVLFLSRIHPKKGCDLAIQAFARIKAANSRLHLVIAGPDGEVGWKQHLVGLAEQCGVSDRITWTGPLYGDRKWGAFATAEVFFLPSHQENFGIVVAEALSTRTPVLISSQINIWREVDADSAGLVADDTIEGATELLQRWLAMPSVEQDAMNEAALACYTRRFTVSRAAESLLEAL